MQYKCDLSVPGVTSIHGDLHKYGSGPKGQSVLLYKTKELRRFQYYSKHDWSGGLYMTTGMSGSRGAPAAATWAMFMQMGRKGFVEQAKMVIT